MTKLTKKYASLVAASVLVFGSFTPAVFAADTTVSGNGSGSENTVTNTVTHTDTAVQDNTATVTNNISSSASTGGNTANDNTGGDTFISTGNARSTVDVSNMLNGNVITMPTGTAMPAGTSLIEGNGSYSTNDITNAMTHTSSAYQTNSANVANNISSAAETGYNDANRNTGGATQVTTGAATSEVGVMNRTNLNRVMPEMGNTAGTAGGAGVSAIMGNGSRSSNSIVDSMLHDSTIVQDNASVISNSVDNYADTGYNRLKDNTGGSVIADTGAAYAGTLLDTMGNVNMANDGSWTMDGAGMTLLDRNGSYSTNSVLSDMFHSNSLYQNATDGREGASFAVSNAVTNDPTTGDNALKRNTLGSGDATAAVTGNARSETVVTTAGNANVAGSLGSIMLPGGTSLDLNFDLGSLLSGLRMY